MTERAQTYIRQLQLKELQVSDPAKESISWGSKNKDPRGILVSDTMVAAPVNTI